MNKRSPVAASNAVANNAVASNAMGFVIDGDSIVLCCRFTQQIPACAAAPS